MTPALREFIWPAPGTATRPRPRAVYALLTWDGRGDPRFGRIAPACRASDDGAALVATDLARLTHPAGVSSDAMSPSSAPSS